MPDFDFDTLRKTAAILVLMFSPLITLMAFSIDRRLRAIEKKLNVNE